MDERTLNELLECSVCLDRLDTSSKVLPCQHTFCRRCLEEIVSTKHELRCPECRFLVEIKVEDLPSNILLIRLLEGMKSAGGAAGSSICTSPTSPRHKLVQGISRSTKLYSSQPCAKALYNYEAKEPGDLSFKKGDVVFLRKQVDENWFHGELNGQNGFFPATYVQVVTPLPPQEVPKCTALYDFIIDDENEKDCLTFHKDEVITVIRRIDEHWAEGKLAEHIGIFPISFVDLNDSAKWLINNQPYPQSSLQQAVGSSSTSSSQMNSPISSQVAPITGGLTVAAQSTSTSVATSNLINQQLIPQQIVQGGDNIAVIGQQQVIGDSSNSNSASSANNVVTTVGILVTTASSVGVSPTAIAMMSSPTLAVNSVLLAAHRPASANNSSQNGSSLSSSVLQQHHHHNSNKRHSFTSIGQPVLSLPVNNQRHSLELPSNQAVVTASATTTTTAANDGAVTTSRQPGEVGGAAQVAVNAVVGASGDGNRPARAGSSGIFIALYNYKPQKDDEVELSKGAYYIVSEKCQDGWYKGTCLRTGVVGVFPGNYVQMVRLPASMKNAPPKRSAVRSPASITTQVTLATSSSAVVTTATSANSSSMLPIDNRLIRSSVNRTHSFPKTSPHLNSDIHSRSNSQGIVKAPSRTITNVTQALSRSIASATTTSSAALSLLSSQAQSSSSAVTSSSSRTGNSSHLGNSTLTTQSHSGGIVSGTDGLLSVDRSHVCANPGASNHSPKTSRRHHFHHYHHHKHSSRGHSSSRSGHSSPSSLEPGNNSSSRASPSTSSRASPAGSCNTGEVSSTAEGSTVAKSASQHSKSSNGSKSTQSASVAADGVCGASGGSDSKRSKDKKERKEHHVKRNESLLKRLASAGIPLKGRKSKSPPPPQVSERREHKHSTHHRSGSEGSILEGATAAAVPSTSAPNTSHRQKSSDKPGKVKPLVRDRFRCIVPYPAQSEIELELRAGDIVYVHKKREDGWFKGTLQKTGKTGLFPCSFVEKL